jgi:ribosomal protein S27AE
LARLEARLEERRQEWAKSYPVYKASRPCPKCGNPTRTTTYRGGYGISPSDRYGMAFAWPYLERFCGRCEYKASEVPLDGTES